MMKESELVAEVKTAINEAIASGDAVRATWLTQQIVQTHTAIEGDDADWHRVCAYGHVRNTVRSALRDFKASEMDSEIDRQQIFKGFERLQRRYLVERDGEQQIINIEELTRDELESKRSELINTATGCMKHADEIAQFVRERFRAEAAE